MDGPIWELNLQTFRLAGQRVYHATNAIVQDISIHIWITIFLGIKM